MAPVSKQIIIKPGEGINNLRFGASMLEAEQYFGKPQAVEKIDDIEDYKSIIWHYWDLGFSLFFDDSLQNGFSCVEVDNRNATLWGENLFAKSETEIIVFFKEKGYNLTDTEIQEWGEKRVSFDNLRTDLYFEKNKLLTINCSTGLIDEPLYIYPN